jgi:hypothetical protein
MAAWHHRHPCHAAKARLPGRQSGNARSTRSTCSIGNAHAADLSISNALVGIAGTHAAGRSCRACHRATRHRRPRAGPHPAMRPAPACLPAPFATRPALRSGRRPRAACWSEAKLSAASLTLSRRPHTLPRGMHHCRNACVI